MQPRRAEQNDEQNRIRHQNAARHGGQAVVQKQRDGNRHRADEACAHDIPQVGKTGETPKTFVEAGPPQHQALHGDGDDRFRREPRESRRGRLEAIAQCVRRDPGNPNHGQVVQHDGQARMNGGDHITHERRRRPFSLCINTSVFHKSTRRWRRRKSNPRQPIAPMAPA